MPPKSKSLILVAKGRSGLKRSQSEVGEVTAYVKLEDEGANGDVNQATATGSLIPL
jgi:hypothetical protein